MRAGLAIMNIVHPTTAWTWTVTPHGWDTWVSLHNVLLLLIKAGEIMDCNPPHTIGNITEMSAMAIIGGCSCISSKVKSDFAPGVTSGLSCRHPSHPPIHLVRTTYGCYLSSQWFGFDQEPSLPN